MITSLKYLPMFVASIVMMASLVFKVLTVEDIHFTLYIRDLIAFFIIYYLIKVLINNIVRMFKNYWKIL